jgi:hypothetical protein
MQWPMNTRNRACLPLRQSALAPLVACAALLDSLVDMLCPTLAKARALASTRSVPFAPPACFWVTVLCDTTRARAPPLKAPRAPQRTPRPCSLRKLSCVGCLLSLGSRALHSIPSSMHRAATPAGSARPPAHRPRSAAAIMARYPDNLVVHLREQMDKHGEAHAHLRTHGAVLRQWHFKSYEDRGDAEGNCPCGHERNRHMFHIVSDGGAETTVGSKCIDLIGDEPGKDLTTKVAQRLQNDGLNATVNVRFT